LEESIRSIAPFSLLLLSFLIHSGVGAEPCGEKSQGNECRDLDEKVCTAEKIAAKAQWCGACPSSTQMQAWKKSKSLGECYTDQRAYSCRHSSWKDLSIIERVKLIDQEASQLHRAKLFSNTSLACISARETRYLDPVNITCARGGSASGLFHLIDDSIEDLLLRFEKGTVAPSSELCSKDWLIPYSCPPQVWARADVGRFRKLYDHDPRLQIRAGVMLMMRKALSDRVTSLRGRAKDQKLYKMIGDGTSDYADAIDKCTQCRNKLKGKVGESVLDCLALATERDGKKADLRAENAVCESDSGDSRKSLGVPKANRVLDKKRVTR
jgi:hypothetical protein